jgi:hypothetical protein
LRKGAKIIIAVSAVALIVAAVLVVMSYTLVVPQRNQVVSLIIKPENSIVLDVHNPTIPANESYVIASAEHASMTKNDAIVNVTLVEVQNENQAPYLFEILKSSFLAQGYTAVNITANYHAIELVTEGQPSYVLLEAGKYISLCQSQNVDLALETANAQLSR